jgi:[acyl-carrier-protein] S-malonyltransferase
MGKIAFVFAGQGAQAVGMGKDLYNSSPAAQGIFELGEKFKQGVKALCFEGPADELNLTVNTQPCLFLTDLACAAALREQGITAQGVAGFSLGEVPAAGFAGVLSEEQAFAFVCRRAELMQACAKQNPGEMFALLRLSSCQVEEICAAIGSAWAVNYNSPAQTVVACSSETSEKLKEAVLQAGGKAIQLAVSGAFHSPFMDEASRGLAEYLKTAKLNKADIPIYSNVTAQVYNDAHSHLSLQVNHPVRWQQTIENMLADGFDTFVEVGPGKVLSGLIRKIAKDAAVYNVCDVTTLNEAVLALGGTVC